MNQSSQFISLILKQVFILFTAFLLAHGGPWLHAQSVGPLRVHPTNPRYFTNGQKNADGTWQGLFRDNGGSSRLFHSTSSDQGQTWSVPVLTNFPNASSKLYAIKTSRGFHVLALNANPKVARRELHLAVSDDGRTFTRLALLAVPTSAADAVLAIE